MYNKYNARIQFRFKCKYGVLDKQDTSGETEKSLQVINMTHYIHIRGSARDRYGQHLYLIELTLSTEWKERTVLMSNKSTVLEMSTEVSMLTS